VFEVEANLKSFCPRAVCWRDNLRCRGNIWIAGLKLLAWPSGFLTFARSCAAIGKEQIIGEVLKIGLRFIFVGKRRSIQFVAAANLARNFRRRDNRKRSPRNGGCRRRLPIEVLPGANCAIGFVEHRREFFFCRWDRFLRAGRPSRKNRKVSIQPRDWPR